MMLRNFNDLCGSTITVFIYATAATIGYKAGLKAWDKIQIKLAK